MLKELGSRSSASVTSRCAGGERASRFRYLVVAPLIVVFACGGKRPEVANKSAPNETLEAETTAGSEETATYPSTASSIDTRGVTTWGEWSGTMTAATDPSADSIDSANDSSVAGTESETWHSQGAATSSRDSTSGEAVTVETNSGASSDAVPPSPELLAPGCEPRNFYGRNDECGLNTQCTDYSDWTECSRTPSGEWLCTCRFTQPDRVYELRGKEGVEACAVASRFCAEAEPELGDEVCDTAAIDSGDTCDSTLTCGRALSVDPALGVEIRIVDITKSACSRMQVEGLFECGCSRLDDQTRRSVEADSAADACVAFSDFCLDPAAPSADSTDVCTLEASVSDSEGCELIESCTTAVASAGGLAISEFGPRGAYCSPISETHSRCYCSEMTGSFAFTVPTAEASCEATSRHCDTGVEVLPSGEATCTPTSQYTSYDSCTVDMDCVQPAVVNGQDIVALGRLTTYCRQPAAGEPWWCSCASDQEAVVFELGASDQTPWDVCLAAPQGCMERMPVHLGAYGEFLSPVDPLESFYILSTQ